MTLRPYPFDRSFRGSYSRYRDILVLYDVIHDIVCPFSTYDIIAL
jgi:hypothetical protein